MAISKRINRKKLYSRSKKSSRKNLRIKKRTKNLRNKKSRSLRKKKSYRGGADFSLLQKTADILRGENVISQISCTEFNEGANTVKLDVTVIEGKGTTSEPDIYYLKMPELTEIERTQVYGFAYFYKALKIVSNGKGSTTELLFDDPEYTLQTKTTGTVGYCNIKKKEKENGKQYLLLKCEFETRLPSGSSDAYSIKKKNIVFEVDKEIVCRLGLKGSESCKPLY